MNPNPSGPFSLYNTATQTAQQQHQPQTIQQQAQQRHQEQLYQQQIDSEQLRLQQQQQQFLQQQGAPFQYQAQPNNPHFIQYTNAQPYMAAPIQQQHQSPAFYAHQQMDVQNRLAHLQLQHPQQQRDRRTPSPTRQAPAPLSQQYSSNTSRVLINRNTAGFSRSTLDRAEAARVKLEHLYKVSVEQAVERNQR